MKKTALIISLLSICPAIAFAADATSSTANAGRSGALLLTFAIVFLTRKRAIGGWLAYYYVGLFFSIFILFFDLMMAFQNLNPNLWNDKTEYLFGLISTILPTIIQIIVIFYSALLIINLFRDRNNIDALNKLRYSLLAGLAVNGICAVIDMVFFPDTVFFSIISLIWYSIWNLYFHKSKRVQWVFVFDKWDYQKFKGPPHDVSTESI